ncbi:MAG: hypothetical protein DRJ60_01490 [Thermoprotei archaeon]|nr:MAG: hypothetical protein DRJ60_01490 [Thermoprotei archaeon]
MYLRAPEGISLYFKIVTIGARVSYLNINRASCSTYSEDYFLDLGVVAMQHIMAGLAFLLYGLDVSMTALYFCQLTIMFFYN